jgi:hypothetical protein
MADKCALMFDRAFELLKTGLKKSKAHTHTTLCTAHPALEINAYSGKPLPPPTAATMVIDVHAAHADAPAPDQVPEAQLEHVVEPIAENVPLVHATHDVRLKTKAPARQ